MEKAPYSHILIRLLFVLAALAGLLAIVPFNPTRAQTLGSFDRDRGRVMLNTLKNEIKKNYYDPAFRGIDLEARFKSAGDKIDHATSNGQIFGIVAQVLIDFEDSHLFFIPPQRANTTDYGWQMQMIGDQCYVSAVKPGSDAEGQRAQARRSNQVGRCVHACARESVEAEIPLLYAKAAARHENPGAEPQRRRSPD